MHILSPKSSNLYYNCMIKETGSAEPICPYCEAVVKLENTKLEALKNYLLIRAVDLDLVDIEKESYECNSCKKPLLINLTDLSNIWHKTEHPVFSNLKIKQTQKLKLDFLLFLVNAFTVYVKDEYYAEEDKIKLYNPAFQNIKHKNAIATHYKNSLPYFYTNKLKILDLESNDSAFKKTELPDLMAPDQDLQKVLYQKMVHLQQDYLKINALSKIIPEIPLYVDEDLNYQSFFIPTFKLCYNFREYISTRGVTFENINEKFYKQYDSYLFLDLDGTLATESGISQKTLDYLKKMESEKKVKVIFCSGRPVSALLFLQKDLTLVPTAIGRNGSEVMYYSHNRDLEPALKLDYQNPQISKNLENLSALKFLRQQKESSALLMDVIKQLKEVHELPIRSFVDESIVDILTPLNYEVLMERIDRAIKKDEKLNHLIENLNGLVITPVTTTDGKIFTFAHGDCTKGSAVKKFIDSCKIDRNKTFNIGNGYNDISLINVVGKSYSVNVQNPGPYEKNVHYISKVQGSEGVAECVEQFLNTVLNKKQ